LLTVHFLSLFNFYSNIRILSTFQLNINFFGFEKGKRTDVFQFFNFSLNG